MDQADGDDGQQPDDEHEGGYQEGAGALAQAPEVEGGDDEQDPQAYLDRVRRGRRKGGCERTHARGDGDRHCQGVVHDQRGTGQLAHLRPEVVAGHGVGTTAVGVGIDDLAVGDHEDDQKGDDGDGDGQDEVQGRRAGRGQDDEDRLGPVGHGGESVERQSRQTFHRRDLLARGLLSRQGTPDEKATDHAESVHRWDQRGEGGGRTGTALYGVGSPRRGTSEPYPP